MASRVVDVDDAQEGAVVTDIQKARWASPSDWAGQKQHIIHLYKSLDYPLWKVVQNMREEHDFMATQKMYKYYLRKWGVRKNLRATQVQEFLQDARLMDAKTSTFVVGGVSMDRKRLEKHLKRVSRYQSSHRSGRTFEIIGATTGNGQPAVPVRMPRNSFLPEIECLLHAMKNYVGANFDSGHWSKSHIFWQKDIMTAAHNSAWTAGRLINTGHIAPAFRMLDFCLGLGQAILEAESPLFPNDMYTALFGLAMRHEKLTRSMISFLRDMAVVTHQSKMHPMYIMFDAMSRMTSEQLCQCAWTLATAYRATLSTELGPDSAFAPQIANMYGHHISWIAGYAPVDDGTAEKALRDHARDLSADEKTTFEALEAKVRLANFFLDRQRYDEARSAAEEVLSLGQDGEGNGANNAYLIDDCYRILFWVSRAGISGEETPIAAGRWVDYCTSQFGRAHELTVDALGEVAEYLTDAGDTEAADKARRDHDAAIDDMCEHLGRVELEGNGTVTQRRTMLYGRMSQRGGSACH